MNARRGMFRLWAVGSIVWVGVTGAAGITANMAEIREIKAELTAATRQWPTEADYEATCERVRAEIAAGGKVEPIEITPRLEVEVRDNLAKVVASYGSCLAEMADEQSIDLLPVVIRTVGGDGSTPKWILRNDGARVAYSFATPPTTIERDHSGLLDAALLCLAPPVALLLLGRALLWAFAGFKQRPAS